MQLLNMRTDEPVKVMEGETETKIIEAFVVRIPIDYPNHPTIQYMLGDCAIIRV